ncbi:Fe-S cluster assembly ATPase SufC [Candidatus Woesearchaeota archaeon]|nr:Fe-S cluster assembly ATPase SufC [Candidatus Woesearchaeota archaeon]
MAFLEIRDLKVSVGGTEILKGITLDVDKGEVAALMGPNGAGKSSLGYALMGHPKYRIDSGSIMLGGKSIASLSPTDRAKLGLFLSFQYPSEIPGVTVEGFLRAAYNSVKQQKLGVMEFHRVLLEKMSALGILKEFASRHVNEGFSGGEKKRMEILQFSVLQPKMAVLDETDSGLDVDSLRTVANGIKGMAGTDTGILLITHYQRILNYIKPAKVYVMMDGRIVASGVSGLADDIEKDGYDWIKAKAQIKAQR